MNRIKPFLSFLLFWEPTKWRKSLRPVNHLFSVISGSKGLIFTGEIFFRFRFRMMTFKDQIRVLSFNKYSFLVYSIVLGFLVVKDRVQTGSLELWQWFPFFLLKLFVWQPWNEISITVKKFLTDEFPRLLTLFIH